MTLEFIVILSFVALYISSYQTLCFKKEWAIEKAKQEEPQLETLKSPQDWYAEGKIEFISELERIIWDQLNNGMNGEVPIPDPYAAEDELRIRRHRKGNFVQVTDGVEWDGEAERIDYGWGSVTYHTQSGTYEVEGKRFKSLSEAKMYGEKIYASRLNPEVDHPAYNLTRNDLIKRALELGAPKDKVLKLNKVELVREVFERKPKNRCEVCNQAFQYYGAYGESGPKLAICHTCDSEIQETIEKTKFEIAPKLLIEKEEESG